MRTTLSVLLLILCLISCSTSVRSESEVAVTERTDAVQAGQVGYKGDDDIMLAFLQTDSSDDIPSPSPEDDDSNDGNRTKLSENFEANSRMLNDKESVDDDDELSAMSVKVVRNKSNRRRIVNVEVSLASKHTARLFHNRFYVGSIKHWAKTKRYRIKARRGDIIAIMARGTPRYHGVIAMIKIGRRTFVTGNRRHGFKAIAASKATHREHRTWARPGFKMCRWRKPVKIKVQRGRRWARDFPFRSGAKYVWAHWERKGKPIYLRFRVGRERCRKPRPSPTPRPSMPVGGARCACKVDRRAPKGYCYEFHNKRLEFIKYAKGVCKRRSCTAKYECVQPGKRARTLCVRRYAKYEVKQIGKTFKGRCINKPIRPAKPFYVPYAYLKN